MTIWKTTLLLAVLAAAGCQVDKIEDGELPDIDVDVEGGKLPKYDVEPMDLDSMKVDAPELRVRMDTKTVVVPTIERAEDTTEGR